MQMTFVLLTLACLQVSAHGFAQSITLQEKNAPLEKVLEKIEHQAGVSFVYGKGLISRANPVTVSVTSQSLTTVLDLIFKDQALSYKISDHYVIVSPKVNSANAPPVTIHGRVVNEKNDPLEGISVTQKGTSHAVQTDADGDFTITVSDEQAVLVFSATNIERQEIVADSRKEWTVQVKTKISSLDEVQVIAYGTTTRRLNTGNVTTVSGEDIQRQPVANPLMALEGRVPGMVTTQTSGLPGAAVKVQIRGQNSLIQGSDPLFIIDGVPFAPNNNPISQVSSALYHYGGVGGLSPFTAINPADIETIDILKDADATAIYGSRGANGVVLITTKKGQSGKGKLTFNVYSGASRVTRTADMLSTPQYVQMRREAEQNDSVVLGPDATYDYTVWDTTRYTDFKKLLIGGTAHSTDAQASYSAGTASTQILLGGGYDHETNVFPETLADNKGSFHFSINHRSLDQKFTLAASAIYGSDKNSLLAGDLTSAILLPPNMPSLYDSLGHLNWQDKGYSFENPLSGLRRHYTAQTDNLLGNLQVQYQVLKHLVLRTSLGYNTLSLNEFNSTPLAAQDPALHPLGSSNFGNSSYRNWIIEPQAEYNQHFGKSKVNVLVGGTWLQNVQQGSSIFASGYSSDALLHFSEAAPSIFSSNFYTQYKYEAFFARLNYDWNDTYILNLSGRRDGSSRFGPGNQFANFGAVGAAWIFSNSQLFQKSLPFISYGKLRGSYGTTGNDQISDYKYLDTWTSAQYPYQGTSALRPTSLANPDYAWEINRKAEVAVDLGFLKDRILLSAAYYRNRSSNQLINYKLPLQTGFASILRNLNAEIENSGLELALSSKNIVTNNFSWTTSVNVTFPKNKLVSFPGLATSSYAFSYIIGQSLSTYPIFHVLNVDPATGVYQFAGKDGPTTNPNFDTDTLRMGNLDPKYYGGTSNSFQYKGWQLDVFIDFRKQMGHNYLFDLLQHRVPGSLQNQPTLVLDRWQKPGDVAGNQRFTNGNGDAGSAAYNGFSQLVYSDIIYSDASFARLKNVSLSYHFPVNWIHKIRMDNCRLYLLGQNLFTLTHFKGSDPETQFFLSLPPLKTITAGIQFTF